MDFADLLKNFTPKHKFLIALDSDGTVFNTLELKQRNCFIPNIIKHWNLQPIAALAQATAEHVNLYSPQRGANRFPALVAVFDLLKDHPEVCRRNFILPDLTPLRDWINSGGPLANSALAQAVAETQNPVLRQVLNWSEAVERSVAEIIRGVPPFPLVRESLQKIQPFADVVVVSTAPYTSLLREWTENELNKFVAFLGGQEMGNKTVQLQSLVRDRYAPNYTLMLGDAPGDYQAARANDVLFYPILPGNEEAAWHRFYTEALDKFLNLEFAGDYAADRLAEFENCFRNTLF